MSRLPNGLTPQQDGAFDRLAWAIADHLTSECNQPCALHETEETPQPARSRLVNRNDGAVGDARKRATGVAPETVRLRLRMAFLSTGLDSIDNAMATALSYVAMAELDRIETEATR